MIAIRADANPVIGAGHIVRCLSIAAGLQEIGEKVVLITADQYPNPLIEQAGMEHITLHTDWRLLSKETDLLLPLLRHLNTSLLLVDSYLAKPEYIKMLKNYMAIAYIDDLLSNIYPADVLINYNIASSRSEYEKLYGKSGTVFLLGAEYAPLRPEFRRVKPFIVHSRMRRIFISAGGSNSNSLVAALADRLLHEKELASVHLVAMPGFFGGNDRLLQLQQGCPRLKIVEQPDTVKRSMETCDAAVSAAGSTLYELCACGVPTAVFSFVENQVNARKAFCTRQVMADCGDLREGESQCLDRIVKSLISMKSPAKRASFSEKASKITDGLGALRIAAVLADISRKRRPS